jgi:hypothetical protein
MGFARDVAIAAGVEPAVRGAVGFWRGGFGAVCRLKHPAGFTGLGVVSAMTVLALGYVVAGYGSFLALIPVALAVDAWLDYHAIRSLKLLKTLDH